MNVSQAPVREALLELAAMGLVEERPYSGTFVRHLKASDIEDIYNTRAFLDEYAARQAARLATQEQLDAMEVLLKKMDQAEDDASFAEMDIAFHGMIVDAADSPSLKRAWDNLRLVEWTSVSVAVTQDVYKRQNVRRADGLHIISKVTLPNSNNFQHRVIASLNIHNRYADTVGLSAAPAG